jgi:hypothetical protein
MSYKGKFKPRYPGKYKGDPTNIIYRSLWERNLMRYLDQHPQVIQWSSEEFFIPYKSPMDNKVHRYFPDFWVKKKMKDGTLDVTVIEVKPHAQTKPPDVNKRNATPTGRVSRRYLREVATYGINEAKWKAAREFCADRNWNFQIITEKELGIKY